MNLRIGEDMDRPVLAGPAYGLVSLSLPAYIAMSTGRKYVISRFFPNSCHVSGVKSSSTASVFIRLTEF